MGADWHEACASVSFNPIYNLLLGFKSITNWHPYKF